MFNMLLDKTKDFIGSKIYIEDDMLLQWYKKNINPDVSNFKYVRDDVYRALYEEEFAGIYNQLLSDLKSNSEILILKGVQS